MALTKWYIGYKVEWFSEIAYSYWMDLRYELIYHMSSAEFKTLPLNDIYSKELIALLQVTVWILHLEIASWIAK